MDPENLELLQSLTDPGDLAGGIASYFKRHTSRVRNLLDNIVNQMPIDPDDVGENFDLGSGPLVLANEEQIIKSIELTDLTAAIKKQIADDEDQPPISVTVRNYSGGTTTYEDLSLDQVLQMLKEQGDVGDAVITTLSGYQDWINNPDLNFEQLLSNRTDNLLPNTSVVAEKLKQGITSIATRYSDSIREYTPSVLSNIMSLFGIGVSTYSDQQVSTFSGVNAWTVILGDVVDGVNFIVSQAHGMTTRLFMTMGIAVAKLLTRAVDKLAVGMEKTTLNFLGATDAFKPTGFGGDKTVASADWRYTIDSNYYFSGETTFQSLVDKLNSFWPGRNSNELSIPLFAGVLNIQRIDATRTGFNLQIKPLNSTAINVAWNKAVRGSHLFYNLVQSSLGVISRNNGIDDYPSDFNMSDLLAFFDELAHNPSIYYLDSWKTDADAFMACQCAKIVCFLQLLVMLDSNIPSPPGLLGMTLMCSDIADFNIEAMPNYDSQNQVIEPSNYNMMSYLASLNKLTSAFSNDSSDYNEYAPDTYNAIANLSGLWRFLECVIDTISQLDVLNNQGLSCFLPYRDNIIIRKASFYIPSDSANIDLVKGILKAGLTVAAVAAVIITGLVIRSSLKKKSFAMEAVAVSMARDAANSSDPTMMAKAYKLSKRSRLLGNLAGYAQTGSSQAMTSIISTNSNDSVVLLDIKRLIAG